MADKDKALELALAIWRDEDIRKPSYGKQIETLTALIRPYFSSEETRNASVWKRVATLEAENAKLREALGPFAEFAKDTNFDLFSEDDKTAIFFKPQIAGISPSPLDTIKVFDFLRAKEALSQNTKGE